MLPILPGSSLRGAGYCRLKVGQELHIVVLHPPDSTHPASLFQTSEPEPLEVDNFTFLATFTPLGFQQCPTGRVFQYRVGYWTKYRVAGRVWVG